MKPEAMIRARARMKPRMSDAHRGMNATPIETIYNWAEQVISQAKEQERAFASEERFEVWLAQQRKNLDEAVDLVKHQLPTR